MNQPQETQPWTQVTNINEPITEGSAQGHPALAPHGMSNNVMSFSEFVSRQQGYGGTLGPELESDAPSVLPDGFGSGDGLTEAMLAADAALL